MTDHVNVIVTGPAGSATRFVSRWLEANPAVVARHWSMPSGDKWMSHWPTDFDFDGQWPQAVVLVLRSFESTIGSQVDRGIASCREEAEANIVQAQMRVLTWAVARGVKVYPLIYEEVLMFPESFDALFRWLGVDPVSCPEPVVDGNVKHRVIEKKPRYLFDIDLQL